MTDTTPLNILRSYRMPQEIKDFIAKHGSYESNKGWYCENGTLKIQAGK